MISLNATASEYPQSWINDLIKATPLEGVAFLVASTVVRIFSLPLSAPLVGIGISMITTKLVLNVISRYDTKLLVSITKEACKVNNKYPKLQAIALIFALAVSFLLPSLGFFLGALLGSIGAILYDVERIKLQQQSMRKNNARAGTLG